MGGINPKDIPSAAEFFSPEVEHYETGPEITRMVERAGRLWAITFMSKKDRIGWRVRGVRVSLVEGIGHELRPGDIVQVRCKLAQDGGSEVQLRVEGDGYNQLFWAKRSAITLIQRTDP